MITRIILTVLLLVIVILIRQYMKVSQKVDYLSKQVREEATHKHRIKLVGELSEEEEEDHLSDEEKAFIESYFKSSSVVK
jgi:predicted Holliday junction resolvase-like endonuclease